MTEELAWRLVKLAVLTSGGLVCEALCVVLQRLCVVEALGLNYFVACKYQLDFIPHGGVTNPRFLRFAIV